MNKKLGLAVAGALVAFSSVANAGITIPAGDWTVDIGGNVNAYYTHKSTDVSARDSEGNSVSVPTGLYSNQVDGNSIGTGLLPAAFGIGAKTRQNDLDIAFQFSFFTGTSSGNGGPAGNNTLNIRQAFLTVGDASWGSIKAGRDLGVFGSDAILSDMTLLGVGVSAAGAQTSAGGSSTLGRIGSGYIYADWKGQFAYTTPNFNGLQATVAVVEGFANGGQDLGYEGKVTYDFAANDVTGRVWLSGLTQKSDFGGNTYTSRGVDVGAKVAYQGFGLVGYYYDGRGLDSQIATFDGLGVVVGGLFNANGVKSKDSGGYVQATFVVPGIGTKLGASYGESNSKFEGVEFNSESWIVGAYHPLTKSLNLVAEYTNQENKGSATGIGNGKISTDTVSLGAILFF